MGFDGNMTSDVIYRRRRPLTHHTLYRNIYFSIISYLTAYIVKLYPKSEAPLIGICITTTLVVNHGACGWSNSSQTNVALATTLGVSIIGTSYTGNARSGPAASSDPNSSESSQDSASS